MHGVRLRQTSVPGSGLVWIEPLTCCAPLHHLVVALFVGGNENDLGTEALPGILEQLHCVGSAAALLRVPEDHALGLDVLVDQPRDSGTKSPLLVGSYPNEEPKVTMSVKWDFQKRHDTGSGIPVRALDASGQSRADACSGADSDPTLEHGGGMSDASYYLHVNTISP